MAEKSIIILLFCCIELYLVQTLSLDYTDRNNKVFGEGVFVQSTDLHQEAWLRRYQKHSVFCDKDAVKIVLPSGALSELKVLGKYAIVIWSFFFLPQSLSISKLCINLYLVFF